MGEYIGAHIRFGGTISPTKADELIALINGEGYFLDCDSDEATRENLSEGEFGGWEINYGNLDDLKSFAQDNGLHYRYWCGDGPDWDSYVEVYDAEDGAVIELVHTHSGPALTQAKIQELGSFEKIEQFFAQFDTANFPKLVIQ